MDCASCTERLPDFLLDELPEMEAVLVQEHLNLCATCMRTYKELKGTGKALEAVPAMRAVHGSAEFKRAVRAQAVVELANIVSRLPPDKRLKLEARRAARMSRVIERPPPPRSAWSAGVLLVVLAGVVALSVILLYPKRGDSAGDRLPVGTLTVAAGKVEQFYQRANEPHSAVAEGKAVLSGDAFLTGENGRARFDLSDGGSLFLGPASKLTFRPSSPDSENFVVWLEQGALGARRMESEDDGAQKWELRSEAGAALLDPGAHAYISVSRSGKDFRGEVQVLSGSAGVLDRTGKLLGRLQAGERAALPAVSGSLKPEPIAAARVPAWRLDVVSQAELSRLLGGSVKLLGRRSGAVEVELLYGSQGQFQQDWTAESGAAAAVRPEGGVILPAGARMSHAISFAAPLALQVKLAREAPADASFACGALKTADGGVSVDIARDAAIKVREKDRTAGSVSVPTRSGPGRLETVRLEILREGGGLAAQLSAGAAKSRTLPLSKDKSALAGQIWIQGLGEGLPLDEVRITGFIPAEWLKEKLSQ